MKLNIITLNMINRKFQVRDYNIITKELNLENVENEVNHLSEWEFKRFHQNARLILDYLKTDGELSYYAIESSDGKITYSVITNSVNDDKLEATGKYQGTFVIDDNIPDKEIEAMLRGFAIAELKKCCEENDKAFQKLLQTNAKKYRINDAVLKTCIGATIVLMVTALGLCFAEVHNIIIRF